MTLAAILRRRLFSVGTVRVRKMCILCAIDVVSQFLCQYGLTLAGSSLYCIIYSSCTIWIAIQSRFLIGRRMAQAQWLGCAVVVGGLAVSGGALSLGDASQADVAVGACMVLLGSVSHALTWVLVEMLLHEPDPVLPEAVSAIMGAAGVGTFGLWQLVYTLPRADALIAQPIAAHGGHVGVIWAAALTLTLASLVHAVTFYHLVGRLGSVTAGVMKGAQASAVFVASHVCFCGAQPSQCFSLVKAWSLVLVVAGTTLYALSKHHEQSHDGKAATAAAAEEESDEAEYHKV